MNRLNNVFAPSNYSPNKSSRRYRDARREFLDEPPPSGIYFWPFIENGKRCPRCYLEKPLNEFYTSPNGFKQPYCVDCSKINSKIQYRVFKMRKKELKEVIIECIHCGCDTKVVSNINGCKSCLTKIGVRREKLKRLERKIKLLEASKSL